MDARAYIEYHERQRLSKYACLSENTKGREHELTPCRLRTEFQRDRDRILHSKAFRRLKHKTQVFIAPSGDHFRTRLTHTLEVAQIARTLARVLRLNEDLVEAIAYGHDLGHTPFGHAGEQVLDEMCGEGFEHNTQSLRIVESLERGTGLNLTVEVRDGILNHRIATAPHSLEGEVVRIADKIAYINHDIDDALAAGVISQAELPKESREFFGDSHGKRIEAMIKDTVGESMELGSVRMSSEGQAMLAELRSFMFDRVYRNSLAKTEEGKAKLVVQRLFEYYSAYPEELGEQYRAIAGCEGEERAVCDYIAGMSDSYAIERFEELFIPKSWR